MTQHTYQPHTSNRPGQMTAVMRAMAPTGPKVLRIGLVRDGRVIEERIIKKRQTVTVGPSERNLFVLASRELPTTFRLFELVDGNYYLNFLDGMSGRIALQTGISELSVLQGQARKTDHGYQVQLTEDSRGKVVLGDTTFLFQFVAPPPIQPRPQLPVSVTQGASGVDWPTTMIAAFSFLAHFMAIGALYSDWLDPIVDYEVNVKSLVESVQSLPAPPPLEEKVAEEDTKAEERVEEQPKATPKAPKAEKADAPKQKLSQAEVAALSEELDSFDMGILGAETGQAATADVLNESDSIASSILDKAAASGAGVSSGGPGGLNMPAGGGAIRPGTGGNSLASIGSTGKAAEEGSGKTTKVRGPKGSASVGGAAVAGGTVSNASSVVARMRAGFRACYNRGLAKNPDASGKINLKIKVGPGGEVAGVSASSSGNLPASVVGCVKARAQSGRFSPPQGGSALVSVPVTFVKQ